MTLIKARGKSLLKAPYMTLSDRVVFEQCSKSAKNPISLARCVVPLLDLQNSPNYGRQTDSVSFIEKIAEIFKDTKNYFSSFTVLPKTLDKIVPVNSKFKMTNPADYGSPWNRPVPVKEFYPLKPVVPGTVIRKENFGFNPRPIRIESLKDKSEFNNHFVDGIEWRTKRETYKFSGLSNLEKVKNYYEMSRYVEKFIKKLNDENSEFINKASNIPFKFELKKNKNMTVIENVFQALDSLLSLNMDNKDEKEWLEILLSLSGASRTLDDIVRKIEPEMKEMNEKIYPAILEIEKMEKNWNLVRQSYSEAQKKEIQNNGYAFLESDQIQLIYNGRRLKLDLEEYSNLSKEQKQKRIDNDIRKLAKLDELKIKKIKKREIHENGEITTDQAGPHHDYSQEAEGEHGPIHMITLEPWAFGSRIGTGVALEAVTLSPYAFFSEIMMPEALVVQTLGPRAFVPAILSPSALIARILSPAAFRAEVLSPRALTAFILTPEALIAEVLSPKLIETRILSPEALIIQVLSPSLLAPHILSPEMGGLLILSPSILSPRVLSDEVMTVEILSPHILGGGHSSHEDAEKGLEHQHSEDEHKDIHDLLNPGNSHGHNQNDHGSPSGRIHNEGHQRPFGEAHVEEQPLNLRSGEVREVDLGQIQIHNNFNNIHNPL